MCGYIRTFCLLVIWLGDWDLFARWADAAGLGDAVLDDGADGLEMLGHAAGGEIGLVIADRAENEDVVAVVAHPGVEDFQNRQLFLGVKIDQ